MTAAVAPGGERTEYAYYARGALPGQPELFTFVTSEEELVKSVKEFANQGPVPQPETAFAYDFTQAIAGQFIGTVTDARGNPTTYVLNRRGNPLFIREPLDKETQTTWDAQDILKTSETDAEGRLTEYAYEDGRGNLTKETIKKDGAVLAETVYAYAPVFNKLTYKKDAEGRETTYRLTAQGDVDLVTDPEGNRTENHYDAEGRLGLDEGPARLHHPVP
jgi:YD repeat-containing protein